MSILRRIFGRPDRGNAANEQVVRTFAIDPVTANAIERVIREGHCSCLASKTKKGNPSVPNLHNEFQDQSVPGWEKCVTLVQQAAKSNATILEPSADISPIELCSVVTMPREISSLESLRELRLYGSHLQRLPPEIGQLKSLANLDVYTSYSLHWLPYEITRCRQLRETRMSTRALYGNYKTRLPFPRLRDSIDTLTPETCSVCNKRFGNKKPQPYWTTLRIGTDNVPLLTHSCSTECTGSIPDAPEGFHTRPHKGGAGVGMPTLEY